MRPRGLSHAGFSMIELLIVIGILAILFTFMYKGFERLNRYYTAENVKANTQQSARIGPLTSEGRVTGTFTLVEDVTDVMRSNRLAASTARC